MLSDHLVTFIIRCLRSEAQLINRIGPAKSAQDLRHIATRAEMSRASLDDLVILAPRFRSEIRHLIVAYDIVLSEITTRRNVADCTASVRTVPFETPRAAE